MTPARKRSPNPKPPPPPHPSPDCATRCSRCSFGQDELLDLVITGLLARGHLLLEGLPGLGKDRARQGPRRRSGSRPSASSSRPTCCRATSPAARSSRTPEGARASSSSPGPSSRNLVLADEINRASPKTQSALLEAMQERRVTVLGETHPLPEPFFVLATQNPIELEGTYPLPEAQLDRFLFKLDVRTQRRGHAGEDRAPPRDRRRA